MNDRDTVADVVARLLDAEDEHTEGVMAAILDHLLRLHAHELAEELRQPLTHAECHEVQSQVPLGEVLARRIDPEVH